MHPVIYAVDIGSIASGNFGWARIEPEHGSAHVERNDGTEIAELVDAVALDLDVELRGVALGFECPLFVPVPADPLLLGRARVGEGNRPFSGGPGTAALVTGLVQTAWILRSLHERCPGAAAFLDWDEFARAGSGLYLWEAFVTGDAKAATHVDDALIAATTFRDALPNPSDVNAVEAPSPMSLIGTALLWSGCSQDPTLLHSPCLVIKPGTPATVRRSVGKAGRRSATSRVARRTESLHDRVSNVATQIPPGAWTTYGDIAEMVDAIAIAVGGVLKQDPTIQNAHRILNARGAAADKYPFPIELIEAEGVRFINGHADPRQRWHPADQDTGDQPAS
jgi:alkylated DNA nucleotide flippase Atl1